MSVIYPKVVEFRKISLINGKPVLQSGDLVKFDWYLPQRDNLEETLKFYKTKNISKKMKPLTLVGLVAEVKESLVKLYIFKKESTRENPQVLMNSKNQPVLVVVRFFSSTNWTKIDLKSINED